MLLAGGNREPTQSCLSSAGVMSTHTAGTSPASIESECGDPQWRWSLFPSQGTLTPCSDSVHSLLAGPWKALQLDVSQGVGREEPVLGFLRDFCLLFFSPLHIWAWWLYLWWKKLFQLQAFGLVADWTRIKGVGECERACRFPTARGILAFGKGEGLNPGRGEQTYLLCTYI